MKKSLQEKRLAEKFLKINRDYYLKAKNPLRCHGPEHHKRVFRNAILLADKLGKRGKKIDYEILIPATMLHDLSAYHPKRFKMIFIERIADWPRNY